MAITTSMASSAKKEFLEGLHNFKLTGGDTFKGALYTSAATLSAATTTYSTLNEITGTGYTAGGNALTRVDPVLSGTTAFTDFADTSWLSATITARGLGIYNSTDVNTWISAHDFGGDVSCSAGTLTVVFPTADAANAILRLA